MLTAALGLLPASAQAQAWGSANGGGYSQITPDGYLHYGGPYNGPYMIHGFMHYGNPNVAVPQYGGYLSLGQTNPGRYSSVYQYGYSSPYLTPGYGGYRYTTPSYGGYYNGGVRAGGVYGGYYNGAAWAPH